MSLKCMGFSLVVSIVSACVPPAMNGNDTGVVGDSQTAADGSADSAMDASQTTMDSGTDASTQPPDASTDSGTMTTDSGTGSDGGTEPPLVSIGSAVCYSFARAMGTPSNTGCTGVTGGGELYTLMGANIDLQSGGSAASMNLCELPSTYANLAAVPRSYANCQWTPYIEGFMGLANHGLIIASVDGVHHYRVWIQSNTPPNLTFRFDTID